MQWFLDDSGAAHAYVQVDQAANWHASPVNSTQGIQYQISYNGNSAGTSGKVGTLVATQTLANYVLQQIVGGADGAPPATQWSQIDQTDPGSPPA